MADMSSEAYELDNDGDLYRRQKLPILKNLETKRARGTYDPALAARKFGYLADAAAKEYARQAESGTPWHAMFPPGARREAARAWVREFETESALGNYEHMRPAKYRAPAGPGRATPRGRAGSRRSPARR